MLYIYIFESGILVSAMSKVWEDIDGCAKQYMYALDIFNNYAIIFIWYYNGPHN